MSVLHTDELLPELYSDRRVEAVGRSRPTLSLPAITLFEQHHRAGPSLHQKADRGESWFSVSRRGVEDNRRLRAMHVIRKGQIRWLPKGDVIGQRQFIHTLFGIAA